MKIRFLGTGASEGIPVIGCSCPHCQLAKQQAKVRRRRLSLLIEIEGFCFLAEVPPDIREQLLEYDIKHLDALFVTHDDYAHASGLRQFKYWPESIDVFCEEGIAIKLRERYELDAIANLSFVFYGSPRALYFPQFTIVPFLVHHRAQCYGLLIDHKGKRVAYTSDSSAHLTDYTSSLLTGVDLLIMNTPFFDEERRDHTSVKQALALKEQLRVKQMILTHINHHNKTPHELQEFCGEGILVSLDGMEIEV